MTEGQREPLPRPLLASLQPLPHDRLEPAAARRLREVTRDEWLALPPELSYGCIDLDRDDRVIGRHYYEILDTED